MRMMEYQRRMYAAGGLIAYGGGGGGATPQAPDYSQYISAMSNVGNTLTGYAGDLYKWATTQGQNLGNIASSVGTRAANMADSAASAGQGLVSNWMNTYGPIYQQQADRTRAFAKDLPATMESWAGKYAADAGMAFDASAAATKRKLQGYGLSAPSVGTGAIDAATANQRALGITAASEQGRMAAMQYGDTLTNQTLQTGTQIPTVAGQQQNVGLAAGNQQVNAPESAVSTTAGAYAPSQGYYNTAYPYMSAWGNTMATSYNQALQAEQIGNNAPGSGWGALAGTLIGAAGTVAGAYFGGPAGAMAGGAIGRAVGTGTGITYAEGGEVGAINTFAGAGSVVPASMSPSGGAKTDDVVVPVNGPGGGQEQAAINVGEGILPKDVMQWKGEEWMQKEIAKARQGMQTKRIARPEMSAIQTRAPMAGAPA